ncbi:MAG: tryptophan synthase subunit alpha [Pirellulaceae bacterium]
MPAIDQVFAELRRQQRKAFIPFITAGDPTLEVTQKLLAELVGRGSTICELGIPYSDPIADGPVIQASYTRALEHHVRLDQIFDTIGTTAPGLSAPVVTMVSYAICHRYGTQRYVQRLREVGAAGIIVPDLPVDESPEFAKLCQATEISLIQLVTPTTPRERAVRIAETSTGFLYYVSVTGITGERTELPADLLDNVAWLRARTDLPICIGFGISTPEHVRRLAPVADGLIVGSAIVRRVADTGNQSVPQMLQDVGQYVAELIAALDDSGSV